MTSPACRIAAGRRLRAIQGRCYKYCIGWVCVYYGRPSKHGMLIQCCLDVWQTSKGAECDKGKHANRAQAI